MPTFCNEYGTDSGYDSSHNNHILICPIYYHEQITKEKMQNDKLNLSGLVFQNGHCDTKQLQIATTSIIFINYSLHFNTKIISRVRRFPNIYISKYTKSTSDWFHERKSHILISGIWHSNSTYTIYHIHLVQQHVLACNKWQYVSFSPLSDIHTNNLWHFCFNLYLFLITNIAVY